MTKNTIKSLLFSILGCVIFFALVETLSRVFFVHPGTYDYLERRIIEQKLSKQKEKSEFRVFLYGESTMQGDALYPKGTVEKWIPLYLEDLLGKETARRVNVINLARLGANSRFITQSFLDTIQYKPDLVVFYTAHNDFVQLDNRRSNFNPPPLRWNQIEFWREGARRLIRKSAFLSELNRSYIRLKIADHEREDRSLKIKDIRMIENWEKFYNPTYDAIDHDSYVFKTILARWQENIRKIIRVSQKNHIPVIFFAPVSNFKEYQPNESVHGTACSEKTLAEWGKYYQPAETEIKNADYAASAQLYEKCLQIDPEYAMTYYRLGQCYEKLSRFEEANRFYQMANDKDRVPLRAPLVVNKFYDQLHDAKLPGVTVIKTQKIFEQHSKHGIVDSSLLLDTMHPSLEGQALMAFEIIKVIYENKLFSPQSTWRWDSISSINELKRKLGIDEKFEYKIYVAKAGYVGRFYDKSIEYARKALKINPHSIEAKRYLAWAYWRKGQQDKAVDLYNEIDHLFPGTLSKVFEKYPDLKQRLILRKSRFRKQPLSTFVVTPL